MGTTLHEPGKRKARVSAGPVRPYGTGKCRILLVEDHPIMREGMAQRINSEPDMVVCGEAGTVRGALDAIAAERPDLVLLDLSLAEGNGLDLIKQLKTSQPCPLVLVLSMHEESLYAERALRAGARGYVMKQEPPETVMNAIRKVLAGEAYLSAAMTKTVLNRLGGGKSEVCSVEDLSDRELEIFQLIGRGFSTRDIAMSLGLSAKTIASHRENIKQKLNLNSGSAVVRHAVHWNHATQSARTS